MCLEIFFSNSYNPVLEMTTMKRTKYSFFQIKQHSSEKKLIRFYNQALVVLLSKKVNYTDPFPHLSNVPMIVQFLCIETEE
mmetsp:Transcript_16178/g.16356  ORF Transcript_16178/g.16356 Transcript_16178/m.16356 type:complete len:81 (-) Transcript_16178:72-314(-)